MNWLDIFQSILLLLICLYVWLQLYEQFIINTDQQEINEALLKDNKRIKKFLKKRFPANKDK